MAKQLEFKTRGGRRKNAGRKNKSGLRAHTKRERVDLKRPLHITLKLKRGQPRRRYVFTRMKQACKRTQSFKLFVLQFALLGDHIHMIVEAEHNDALARGMKSLTGALAKNFGMRFKDRYHFNKITTPRQMKNTYKYVLLNFARHEKLPDHIDQYSSGQTFPHWRKLIGGPFPFTDDWPTIEAHHYGLAPPRSWLAHRGWMRA